MTKQEIILEYQNLKIKLGKSPSSTEFYKFTKVSKRKLSLTFGRNAYSTLVLECGDNPNRFSSKKSDLLEILVKWGKLALDLGKLPTAIEWQLSNCKPSESGIYKSHGLKWSEIPLKFQEEFADDNQWRKVIALIPNNHQESELTDQEECYVYLMRDKRNGYYKIGISRSPNYRERTLQSEVPKVELIAKKKFVNRKIASAIEKAFHNLYSHKNRRGEWFSLDTEDIEELKATLND